MWLDLCGPSQRELAALAGELGLHELAVEDALHPHERPKLHEYDTHRFLSAYAVRLDERSGRLVTSELAAFLTQRALVTVRPDDSFDVDVVTLRRVVLPMREVVNGLMRRDHSVVDETMFPYYQDVYDHVLRASEWTESLREMVATIRETQLNIQGNRLNLIMKKVTGWAAIVAVPTAITGFYGQNVPYPGSEQSWGFWVSTTAIVLLSGGLYALFKRRDWL